MPMNEFRNLNGKRVFNTSSDRKHIDIRLKDFITRITAGTDGTVIVKSIKAA